MTSTAEPTIDEAKLVDDYVLACAAAAAAEAEKEKARQRILATGRRKLTGSLHKLAVSTCAGRTSTDIERAVQDGLLTREQLAPYQKTGQPITRITASLLS